MAWDGSSFGDVHWIQNRSRELGRLHRLDKFWDPGMSERLVKVVEVSLQRCRLIT